MDINFSWYLNGDPEYGLNPLLKFVNSNSDEENKAIISWANKKGIELIDLKNRTEAELINKRNEYRQLLDKVLAGTNLEGEDCCLRGFGTFAENKLLSEICEDQTHGYHEFKADKNDYWEAVRQAEYTELGFNPDSSRRREFERILKLNSASQFE
ncbi:hypothetical protein EQO05_14400 [Methanosarcina sp. MSH10X1]|uniref:hypothetical protein n=1 Tax=Methanosarcina sp. MSH10X1 TaxID=2507075 RepID=UPI000FFBF99B|nr:hypothetical protein [Methanosarcina sp. MSH10X1]RXA16231.1 hypothetical protein EQO05_14400 [Methanosarcina sp. MSH10X1]